MYNWITLLYTWNYHHIVNQLYSNKYFLKNEQFYLKAALPGKPQFPVGGELSSFPFFFFPRTWPRCQGLNHGRVSHVPSPMIWETSGPGRYLNRCFTVGYTHSSFWTAVWAPGLPSPRWRWHCIQRGSRSLEGCHWCPGWSPAGCGPSSVEGCHGRTPQPARRGKTGVRVRRWGLDEEHGVQTGCLLSGEDCEVTETCWPISAPWPFDSPQGFTFCPMLQAIVAWFLSAWRPVFAIWLWCI